MHALFCTGIALRPRSMAVVVVVVVVERERVCRARPSEGRVLVAVSPKVLARVCFEPPPAGGFS